ncbi:MAG TPA: glycosyltransferase [Elainellaceae cyanobacterium]
MPLISVIIPMFNAENTIRETIDSVLQQTLTDFEIIVIDDGSTDASLDAVKHIHDSRIRVLSQPNSGAPASRNRGLAESTGEFIAFLDADDVWTPDKLAAQIDALQTNPDAAVAYSWTQFIDESGQVLSSGRRITVSNDAYEKLLVMNFLENGSNPLIRRPALAEIGGFDESLLSSQDRDLYLRLAMRYRFVTVPKYQILYRMTSGSITSNLSRQERQALEFVNRAFIQAPASLQHLKPRSLAHLYRYLTLRGLEDEPTLQRSLAIARCFALTLRYEPSLLWRQTQLMTAVAAKIAIGIVLPSKQAQAVLKRIGTRRQQQRNT